MPNYPEDEKRLELNRALPPLYSGPDHEPPEDIEAFKANLRRRDQLKEERESDRKAEPWIQNVDPRAST